jgi:hypothetical protein
VPCVRKPADSGRQPATGGNPARAHRSSASTTIPGDLSARAHALRRVAVSMQVRDGCTHAPRPGSRRRSSRAIPPGSATTRTSSVTGARVRQPMQVRSGRATRSPYPRGRLVRTTQATHSPGPGCGDVMSSSERPIRETEAAIAQQRNLPPLDPASRRCRVLVRPGYFSAAATSGRMSMRQPVSRAASRAFWPSRPMARLSW